MHARQHFHCLLAPGGRKQRCLSVHLEGKRVKVDQALTGLSLNLFDVSTADVRVCVCVCAVNSNT